jgi:hypothetical protein
MMFGCKEEDTEFEDLMFVNIYVPKDLLTNVVTLNIDHSMIHYNKLEGYLETKFNNDIEDGEILLMFETHQYLLDVQSSFKSWDDIVKQYINDFYRMQIFYDDNNQKGYLEPKANNNQKGYLEPKANNNQKGYLEPKANNKQTDPLFLINLDINYKDNILINNPLCSEVQMIKKLKLSSTIKTLIMLMNQASYGYIFERIQKYYQLGINNDYMLIDSKDSGLIYHLIKDNNEYTVKIKKKLCISKPKYNNEGYFLDYEIYKTLNIEIEVLLKYNNTGKDEIIPERYGLISWTVFNE